MSRRRIILLFLVVLIAAALNWPVAWLAMMNPPAPGPTKLLPPPGPRQLWNSLVPNGEEDVLITRTNSQRFLGYTRLRLQGGDVTPTGLQDARVRNLKVEWSGLPFRSVWCYRYWDGARGTNELIGAIEIEPRVMSPPNGNYGWIDSLPYLPIWRGLVGNTLVYLVLMVTPFFVVPRLVRWRQRVTPHGYYCPNCGYDLRESLAGCPECGRGRTDA